MSTGPDGDDDEAIELEPEAAGADEDLGLAIDVDEPAAKAAAPPQFKHAPLAQAAAEPGVEHDIALFDAEAKAHPEPARRAVLLGEVARLEELRARRVGESGLRPLEPVAGG